MAKNLSKLRGIIFGSMLGIVSYVSLEMICAGLHLTTALDVLLNYQAKKEGFEYRHKLFYEYRQDDKELTFSNTSNLNARFAIPTMNLDFIYDTDELGFRNKQGDKETSEIVAVGDSFTYGFGINYEELWTEKLESKTKQRVANFGVTGYAPWQYNAVMKKYPLFFRNRTILYGIYMNDFTGETKEITQKRYEATKGFFSISNPDFEVIYTAELPQEPPFLERTITYKMYERLAKGKVVTKLSQGGFLKRGENDFNFRSEWFSDDNLNKVFKDFYEAKQIADGYNSTIVPVFFTSRTSVYREEYIDAFGEDSLVNLEEEAFRKTGQYFDGLGVKCVDLTQRLREEKKKGIVLYNPVDAHLNPHGNEIAAQEIARALTEWGYTQSTKTVEYVQPTKTEASDYVQPTKTTNDVDKKKPNKDSPLGTGIIHLDEIDF
ncbi:hypothetical protein HY636_03975 [Candidatus Woesearchaeota archaeon]|nr:hypothetical protein [Candidatus Woesearchaeota archaeon]